MHFDALTLACMADELRRTVLGGRIQQVLAPDAQSLGMEVYAHGVRRYLVIHLEGRAARLHLAAHKLRRGVDQPSPLMLLLRKYVRDGILDRVEQPDPAERVLHLQVDHREQGVTTLVVELLGQRSNLILLRPDGRILDCFQRVWPGEGVSRPLAPGQPYAPPPPQPKLPPMDDGSADYYARLAAVTSHGGRLWQALVAHVAGVSPTLGRELAWRATGDAEAPVQGADRMALVAALQSLWTSVQRGDWRPGFWREEGAVVGFSAFEAHVRGEFVATASLSEALERYYDQPHPTGETTHDAYAGLRATVAAQLRRAEQRIQRQLAALAGDEPAPGEAETLREQAEWLLALSGQVQPGQRVFEVDLGEARLSIPLEEGRSPVEQAERMFKRAGRMERAARFIPERRARLHDDLAFLAQLQADLALAENQPEIAAVREELRRSRLLPAPQKKPSKSPAAEPVGKPRCFLSPQGFEILVGRNARQNERVTFDLAGSGDLWLHVRGAPGSHVVIRSGGQRVSDETLRMAAQLAAYFSTLRGERAAPVSYTARRNVSRAPGGRPGQVTVRNEQTITVRAELPGIEA